MVRVSPEYGGVRSWAPWNRGGRGYDSTHWEQELPVNIYDSAETWIVTAPVPGMESGDVQLDCEGNSITIDAQPKGFPQLPKDYLLHEWHVGPYHRRIDLPAEVEANACDATIAAGMLVVRIRKPEWEKVVHIPVRVTGSTAGEGEPTALASEMEAGLGQPAAPQGERAVR
jgi:HSP20 family molecular chaperone IbpA